MRRLLIWLCFLLFALVLLERRKLWIEADMLWNRIHKTAPHEVSDKPYKYTGIRPLLGAVTNGDLEDVKRLAPLKKGMEDRTYKGGETAFMFAMFSGQTEAAEILLDNGANPWTYDEFGTIVHADDEHSPTTERDAKAYWRVREKLLKMGYPLHAPKEEDILKMAAEGKWPPAFVSDEFKRTSRP